MSYSIRIKASAAKALRWITATDRARLVGAIDRLAREPGAGGTLKGEFSGLRRLRVGRFRIVYEVIEGELVVLIIRTVQRRDSGR
ncbi:MAG: type II toxin-antitoxin system RelE/ParE family toxin [Acidobacteriota bacterium]